MIKILLLTISIFITLNASSENATKDDIKMLIHQMDKRFEQVDKRFEQVDKRLELMQQQMDKRAQEVDRKFEQVDKRFDTQLYIMVTGFTLIMGYLLKERTIITKQVKQELEPELVKKADKNILDKVIAIIEDMAKNDKEVENMLIKHHMRLA